MRANQRRAGFAVSPIVWSLALLVVCLGLYKAWIIWSVPTRTSFEVGYKLGIAASPLVWLAGAALVGWIVYRARARSFAAANVGAGIVLVLPALAFSAQLVNYWMHGSPAPAVAAIAPERAPAARESREGPKRKDPPRADPLSAVPETTRPDPTPSDPPEEASLLSAAPTAVENPAPDQPPAPVAPRRPPPRVSAPTAENPVIKATLDALSAEQDAAAGGLVLQAEPLLDAGAKIPPHVRTTIEQRIKSLAALHKACGELADQFRATKDEAEKRLKDAGVSESEAFAASVRYTLERRSSMRAVACESYARFCDAATEEALFLLENISKWSLDGKGVLVTKDNSIKSRENGLRMRIEAQVRQREQMAAQLRGK